jgi:hypothetical protein
MIRRSARCPAVRVPRERLDAAQPAGPILWSPPQKEAGMEGVYETLSERVDKLAREVEELAARSREA